MSVGVRRRGWLVVGVLAALAVGCGDGNEDPAMELQKEVGEALNAAADYAGEQKRAVEKRARKTLDAVDRELEETSREIEESSGGLNEAAEERLEAATDRARSAHRKAQHELDDLATASTDHWKEALERLSEAFAELEEARQDVMAALSGHGEESD